MVEARNYRLSTLLTAELSQPLGSLLFRLLLLIVEFIFETEVLQELKHPKICSGQFDIWPPYTVVRKGRVGDGAH